MTVGPHQKSQTTPDGKVRPSSGAYGSEVEVAAISGDGRRALTVHAVGVAEVWDAASGDKVGEVRPTSPLEGMRGLAPRDPFEVFIESAALGSRRFDRAARARRRYGGHLPCRRRRAARDAAPAEQTARAARSLRNTSAKP